MKRQPSVGICKLTLQISRKTRRNLTRLPSEEAGPREGRVAVWVAQCAVSHPCFVTPITLWILQPTIKSCQVCLLSVSCCCHPYRLLCLLGFTRTTKTAPFASLFIWSCRKGLEPVTDHRLPECTWRGLKTSFTLLPHLWLESNSRSQFHNWHLTPPGESFLVKFSLPGMSLPPTTSISPQVCLEAKRGTLL